MNGLRQRALALGWDGGGAFLSAALLGALGAVAFTVSAYAVSPFALPLSLLVAGFVLVTALRPAWAVAGALLAVPLEIVGVGLLTGQVSPTQGALAVVAAVWVVRFLARPETVARPGLHDLPIFMLLVAIAVGLTVATDVATTARILASFVILFLVYLQIRSFTSRELRMVLAAFVVGAGILGFIGGVTFLQSREVAPPGSAYNPAVRALGTFEHPNNFASILTVALLPGIALVIGDLKRYFWLFIPIAGAVTGLVFSLSRGGITAFVCGLLLLVVWTRARWVALGVTAVLAALTLAGVNPIPGSDDLQVVEERLSTLDTGLEADDRELIWATAIDIASEHPLIGLGMGQFEYEASRRGLVDGGGGPYVNAHNVFLSFASETGLIGLVAFLAFIGQVAARGVGAVRTARERPDRVLAIGLLAALLAFVIQGLTVAQVSSPILATALFVLAGAIVGLWTQAGGAAPTSPA